MDKWNVTRLIIIVWIFYSPIIAQDCIYEHLDIDEGLSSSQVYDVYQDQEGYMWFATDKGLTRYNGSDFEIFNSNDGLSGNVILRFYPQKNGQVWCYALHSQSLFYFEHPFKGFTEYRYNEKVQIAIGKGSSIKSVHLNDEGLHLGVLGITGQLIVDNDGKVNHNHDINEIKGDTFNLHITTGGDSFNEFYIANGCSSEYNRFCHGGFERFTHIDATWLEKKEKVVFMANQQITIKSKDGKIIPIGYDDFPIGIKRIDVNHFFVGYLFGGGKIFDGEGNLIQEFLRDKSVTNVLLDSEGGYWFTTLYNGVYYVKEPTIQVLNKANYDEVSSLAKNKKNELLVGCRNGNVAKIAGKKFVDLFQISELEYSPVFIEFDSVQNTVYSNIDFEFESDLLQDSIEENLVFEKYTLNLSEPVNGNIYSAHFKSFVEIKANKQTFIPYRVLDVCPWQDDIIVATPVGVFKYIYDQTKPLFTDEHISKYRSDDIDINPSMDKLFIATQGLGIIVYTNDNDYYMISKDDGLYSNSITEVNIENDSTIWACTNKGLNKISFTKNNISISGISKDNGLNNNEIVDVEIINDTVWVGTKEGICYFPKNLMTKDRLISPYFKLKEVHVNGKLLNNLEVSSFRHTDNNINIILDGITYANNKNVYFKYRLSDKEQWLITKSNNINLLSLLPGAYNFEIQLCIEKNECLEKSIKYDFVVQLPFWRTWWFFLICGFILSGLIYLFFRTQVLTYNKDITRELIRLLIRRLKRKEKFISIRENGNDVKINTTQILYVKSSRNYIDIKTENKTYTARMNIGRFLDNTPDKLEFVRVHRSYIVRLDKITSKSKNYIYINSEKIPVGQGFLQNLKKIQF